MKYDKLTVITVLFVVFFILTTPVFADDASLSANIANKEIEELKNALANANSEELPHYERLILDAAKTAVINSDYEYAATLSELVLLNNFDNSEAQRMFTSIQETIRKNAEIAEKKRKEEEEKRLLEEKRLFEEQQHLLEEQLAAQQKAEEEQRLLEEERLLREQQLAADEEAQKRDAFIKSVKVIDKNNFPFNVALVFASFDFASSPFADSHTNTHTLNCRYGFGANLKTAFVHPYIKVALALSFAYSPVVISGNGNKMDINGHLAFGLPSFTGPFALSLGYRRYSTDKDFVALYKIFAGPSLGLGVNDIRIIENLKIDFFADYNLMPLITDSVIDFAFDTVLNVRYAFPLNSNIKLFVENETILDGLIISSDFEWSVKTAFSLGVTLNDN